MNDGIRQGLEIGDWGLEIEDWGLWIVDLRFEKVGVTIQYQQGLLNGEI
ncbi:hypothetical protein [Lutimonas sp.]